MTDRKPYRYVCKQEDPQWLEERRKVFTASEIAAFFGEGYKSQKEVLQDKLGHSDWSPPTPGDQAWWGLFLERENMRAFSVLSGLRTRPTNAFLVSQRNPGLGATIDGLCREGAQTGLIEMKNVNQVDLTGALNAERWANGFQGDRPRLPQYRWIQVQAQLYVTGYPFAYLCAKIGACDMVWHRIEPDVLFFEDLEAAVAKAQKKLDKLRAASILNNEVFE